MRGLAPTPKWTRAERDREPERERPRPGPRGFRPQRRAARPGRQAPTTSSPDARAARASWRSCVARTSPGAFAAASSTAVARWKASREPSMVGIGPAARSRMRWVKLQSGYVAGVAFDGTSVWALARPAVRGQRLCVQVRSNNPPTKTLAPTVTDPSLAMGWGAIRWAICMDDWDRLRRRRHDVMANPPTVATTVSPINLGAGAVVFDGSLCNRSILRSWCAGTERRPYGTSITSIGRLLVHEDRRPIVASSTRTCSCTRTTRLHR